MYLILKLWFFFLLKVVSFYEKIGYLLNFKFIFKFGFFGFDLV